MAARRTSPERPPAGGAAAVRRAPFSDNPRVGARGQQTQQRILDAALRVFGDDGFHGASVERIAKLAGCSRVSFYQYFASKEDVFGHVAAQLARQVSASTEALDLLTPDLAGWTAMRAWVDRYTEIYARYEPVFHAYQAAVESDETVALAVARAGEDTVAKIRARFVATTLPARRLDPVIRVLLQVVNHTFDVVGILRTKAPDAYPDDRLQVAITDVVHRTLFGRHDDVNVHDANGGPPPALALGSIILDTPQHDDGTREQGRALSALLGSARDVFVERGYHATRVDDLVAAAGVSHGAFYRYFRGKDELARVLTARAREAVAATLTELPDVLDLDPPAGRTALRRWLRRYNAAHAHEAGMLRVWVDAALQDPALRAESAPPLDWGRRRMARYLQPRGFGDLDMDAVVMVALLGVFGPRQRSAAEVDAAAHVIERGLFGR
ncbi:MAG TPA: TetR family transcriptional regulator [Acidimicrobiia bacterium]|nr:TetR family transcriptional regulator [Acidimicrobiia bacterium]